MTDEPGQNAVPTASSVSHETVALPQGRGAAQLPSQIGRYRILRIIGEGGMGVVYEAEQDNPRRTVALKVIRPGLTTPSVLRRFAHETQILGRLQHPGIAQIHEAGTADTGQGPQPYFAMEFIRGRPLTLYVEEKKLGTRDRLNLLAMVCDAVHHAHQKGVIHRDLKPGNILVDDLGQPRILDFGIARATESDIQATMQTDVGQIIGTLPYMSPEQVAADPSDLDTRSDVYALGVIAYELLTGRLPHNLSRKMITEAARIIREEDPSPLSTFNRTLRGDVETIVSKALEKDKTRRYQSAAAMAEDIRRYLGDEPITARPASALYQFRKFARRNRGLVGGAAAVTVVLILGTIVSLSLAIQATRARNEESRQRQRAEDNLQAAVAAVDKYLTNVSDSPELKAHGLQPLRKQLLGTAREFYERFVEQRSEDPKLQSLLGSAYMRLGDINRELGASDDAERAYLQAMAIFERPGHQKDEWTNRSGVYNNLALVYRDTGRFEQAQALFTKALTMSTDLPSESDVDPLFWSAVANAHDNMGTMYIQKRMVDKAEEHHKKGLAIRRKILERLPDSARCRNELAISNVNIGMLYATTGRLAEAEPYLVEAISISRSLVEEFPRDAGYQNALAASLNNLGGVRTLLGENATARESHLEAMAIRERLAVEHPAVPEYAMRLASSYTNLGELDVRDGNMGSALSWLGRAISMFDRLLEKEPRDTTTRYYLSYTLSWQAKALDALRRFEEALAAWDRAIEFDDRNDAELRTGRADTQAKKQSQ